MPYLNERYGIPITTFPTLASNYRQTILTSGTQVGIASGAVLTTRIMIRNKPEQIRQTGVVRSLSLAIASLSNVVSIVVEFWRREKAETTGTWPYYYVDETTNLYPLLSVGSNTIPYELLKADGSYINLQEGDTMVLKLTCSGVPCQPFYSQTGVTNAELRTYLNTSTPDHSSFDWKSQTATATTTIQIAVEMNQPEMMFFGDSIISGAHESSNPLHCSYACNTIDGAFSRSPDIEWHIKTIPYMLAQLLGITSFQNLGVNSNRTTQIAGRLPTDVNSGLPNLIVIEGGTNDLNGGVGWGTVGSNITTMMDACAIHSNIVIYLSIFPRNDVNDTLAGTRRTWNGDIETLVEGYNLDNNFHFINLDSTLGKIRVSTGELDDLKDEYDCGDGLHLNTAGCQVVAQTIYDYLVSNDLVKWIV